MKRITACILILFFGISVFAQDDAEALSNENEFGTVFRRGNDKLFISGFGGPVMSFASVGDNFAHMMGGGGGVIVNNFFFGGYGVGLTTPVDYIGYEDVNDPDSAFSVEFGHGGLWTGFIIAPKRPFHLSLSAQFGWGAISQLKVSQYDLAPVSSARVFVITPIAEIEMNFSHFLKVGIGTGMSYLRGPGIDRTAYQVRDFIKPSVFVSFKFGWFN